MDSTRITAEKVSCCLSVEGTLFLPTFAGPGVHVSWSLSCGGTRSYQRRSDTKEQMQKLVVEQVKMVHYGKKVGEMSK